MPRPSQNRPRQRSELQKAHAAVAASLPGKTLVRVNYAALKDSRDFPQNAMFFLEAGWYRDQPFQCRDCGKVEIWTDTQQKWWYEVAKGSVITEATRCRTCRQIVRAHKAEHRRKTAEGIAKKKAKQENPG